MNYIGHETGTDVTIGVKCSSTFQEIKTRRKSENERKRVFFSPLHTDGPLTQLRKKEEGRRGGKGWSVKRENETGEHGHLT